MTKKNILNSLPLKDMLQRVREELVESEKERIKKGQDPLFRTHELTLEINFVLTKSSDTKDGLKLEVPMFGGLNFESSGTNQSQEVHKIILKFKPNTLKKNKITLGSSGGGLNFPNIPIDGIDDIDDNLGLNPAII